MYIIGLCGRSGSGKSTVSAFLGMRGVARVDADEVCRYVYANSAECIDELCRRFGDDIYAGGVIDRPLLSARAFGQADGISDLNKIAHKYITAEMEKCINEYNKAGKRFVLLDAPLLFEAGLDKRCDAILAVVCPYEQQVERLMARDGKTKAEIKQRLKAQISVKDLARTVDYVIVNDGTEDELKLNTYKAFLYIQLKLGAVKRSRRRYRVK